MEQSRLWNGQKLRQNNLKKWSLLLLALVVLPLILTAASATKRFDAIGILNDTLPLAQISDFTANATKYTPAVLLRFFYNKPVFYSRLISQKYFAHFTFDFYFLSGGATARHIIPAQGEFYLVESILMLCGLYYLLTQAKFRRIFPYWLIFLAVSPIAAAFTSEEIPSSTRSFPLILPLIFLIALGIYWLLSLKKSLLKYGFVSVLAFATFFGFMYFVSSFLFKCRFGIPGHVVVTTLLQPKELLKLEANTSMFIVSMTCVNYIFIYG